MSRFRNFLARVFGGGPAPTQSGPSPPSGSTWTPPNERRQREYIVEPFSTEPIDGHREVPDWAMRALPLNATRNEEFERQIEQLAPTMPHRIWDIFRTLNTAEPNSDFDSAANCAIRVVWQSLDAFLQGEPQLRMALVNFAGNFMPPPAAGYVVRRLIRDPDVNVRRAAEAVLKRGVIQEVALPIDEDGEWNATGWQKGIQRGRFERHQAGPNIQSQRGVPELQTNAELRGLLGIASPRHLGYLLLGTDAEDGPYARFTIPKRDGSDRQICAPKTPLRLVQRKILDQVLSQVAVHPAAHGFVPGRSTVTNAAVHQGAKLIIKFDLSNFFPTIGFFRVAGLFASLGYQVHDMPGTIGRTSSGDNENRVACTLARLCTYTPSAHGWHRGYAPQGAPTSPTISNLVCRKLDTRLAGLAQKWEGRYTRYADDLTFSFDADDITIGRFRWWVDQICQQEGFLINYRKFRVLRQSQRQSVTGIVVNDCLRVPRDQRRRFRAILHNCRKHGIESQARGQSNFRSWMRGFASYIHMVHPEEGRRLLYEVDELLGPGDDGTALTESRED